MTGPDLPRLRRLGQGNLAGRVEILFSESHTWEQAQAFAGDLALRLGLAVAKRIDGPDAWIWEVKLAGTDLVFAYDDYPCETTLGSVDVAGDEAIQIIFTKLRKPA